MFTVQVEQPSLKMPMRHQSAEEQLQDYKAKMGDELGTVFHHCRQNFLNITVLWDEFVTLFGIPERVALMNEAGSRLAHDIFWQFLNGVTLGITRLLDPPETGKFRNLTLARLGELCPQSISTEVGRQLAEIENSSVTFRALRDKIIAHNDVDHAMGRAQTLQYASRRDITVVLKKILELLNTIDFHFTKSITHIMPMGNRHAFDHLLSLHRGALIKKEVLASLSSHDLSLANKYDWPEFLIETEEERNRYR